MRVCLICEGCYPYVPGGVSGWIQMLCSEFREVEFVIWSIATTREEMPQAVYDLPPNVKELRTCYLGDEVLDQPRRRIVLSPKEKNVLRELMTAPAQGIDWCAILELVRKYRQRMNDILMSEAFYDICLEEYRRQESGKVFNHFLWNFRGIYFPLMCLLSDEIPQADLYHAVSTGYAGILGSCASYVTGKPFLLSEHGIYTREREEDIIRSQWVDGDFKQIWIDFFKKLSMIAYQQADRVTTLFEVNRALQIELHCPAEKIERIPNGVSCIEYEKIWQMRCSKNSGTVIGAVLRVVPIKDVKTMLLSFDLVKKAVPEAVLKIMGNCGENPAYYEECLELLEELGTQDVTFLGQVDVKAYLPEIDLMLLSSISEGQPLAMLEGMAAGIPFVATNVGNCRELLEGAPGDLLGLAGRIVPVMDSAAMADAVIDCVTNPKLLRQMGETGRMRVAQHYSKEAVLRQYWQLYQTLGQEKAGEEGYGRNWI